MKKRIAAMLLAAVMFFHMGGEACRPKAVGAVATAVPAIVTQILYGIMTGRAEEVSEAFLELGVDILQATDEVISYCIDKFQRDASAWVQGWINMYTAIKGWFDDGTIELDDEGKAYITYSMYRDLCTAMYDYVDLKLDLGSTINHSLINTAFDEFVFFKNVPKLATYYDDLGCSYAPVYYSDTAVYIGECFVRPCVIIQNDGVSASVDFRIYDANGDARAGLLSGTYSSEADYYSKFLPSFHYSSDLNLYLQYVNPYTGTQTCSLAIDNWYCFDSSGMNTCPSDEVDTSLSQGYIAVDGLLTDFIPTVSGFAAAPDTSQIEDLSDPLDDLLVLNPDPGLVIDPDPAIPIPTDAVTVTDIPLVDDMTLTDVMADTMPIGLDMQLPKTIFDKFPFSLPFDLYRLLTIFVAEPVTPVFRIPISNVNVDMSAFEGNQTFGEYSYSETFEPMFEIDEEIVIDFSGLPFIQAISYTCFIVGFIAFLILITTKLIHH